MMGATSKPDLQNASLYLFMSFSLICVEGVSLFSASISITEKETDGLLSGGA